MKRIVSAFLAGAMALSLAACGGAASTSTVASSAASGSAAASETAASDLDYIKEKGKLVIGYTVYEPTNSGSTPSFSHTAVASSVSKPVKLPSASG